MLEPEFCVGEPVLDLKLTRILHDDGSKQSGYRASAVPLNADAVLLCEFKGGSPQAFVCCLPEHLELSHPDIAKRIEEAVTKGVTEYG